MAQEKTGGLAGIIAGNTAIATVGKEGKGLTYRGYSIYDLAEHSTFEEVAYLLICGRLPTRGELNDYKARLVSLRALPAQVKTVLEQIPKGAHPMDVMRTGCSMLGALEPEEPGRNQIAIANRLTGCFSAMLLYWHHFATEGKRIETETDDDSTAGHFLHLLHQKKPDELHRRAVDVSLILYPEHEFNASTFTARTIASTLPDFYSAVTGAIGALRGPLHGGANEAAMELIEQFKTPDDAEKGLLEMMAAKKNSSWVSAIAFTRSPIPAPTSSKPGRKGSARRPATSGYSRYRSALSRSCAARRSSFRIWTSTAPAPITSAAYPR
jgi:2-methylcitrate synthase